MSLTQALCAIKATPCNKCSFHLLGHRRQSVLALPWLVCVRGAKQNPDKVLRKALTALQAVLQEDDSAGGFFDRDLSMTCH